MVDITTGVTAILGVMTTTITAITANPILVLFLAGSIIGLAVGIFRKLKG